MMNLFYLVWDYVDERLFDKRNTSDCAQFSELMGWTVSCRSLQSRFNAADSTAWAIFWFTWEVLVFTSAIFAGICVFKVRSRAFLLKRSDTEQKSSEDMYREA